MSSQFHYVSMKHSNDREKRKRLRDWMKRHKEKVDRSRRKLEHSKNETERLRGKCSDKKKKVGEDSPTT